MLWHNKRSIRLHLYRVCCCFSWHYIHLSEGSVLWLQRCGLSQTSQTSTVSLKCLIIPVVFRLCLVHAPDSKSEPDSLFTLQNSDMKKFQVSRVRGVPVLIKPVSQRTFHSTNGYSSLHSTWSCLIWSDHSLSELQRCCVGLVLKMCINYSFKQCLTII